MHNRRNFLLQGSMATAALLLTRPAAATDKVQSWFPQLSIGKSYLTIVHGNHLSGNVAASFTAENSNQHVLLVDTGLPHQKNENTLQQQEDVATGIYYTVTKKGSRNIGVVYAPAQLTTTAIKNIDSVAGKLKQEHRCQLVVCAWQVATHLAAFKRPEREIAQKTQHVDVFAGTAATSDTQHTVIAMNQLQQEVLFQYHSGRGFSKMQIGFDANGHRNHILFG